MVAGISRAGSSSLRGVLKERTRALHEELDRSIGHGVLDPQGYAAFLAVQYSARAPIERWAAKAMAADIAPPATAPLIAADLAELGMSLPREARFAVSDRADPIGAAWALGGSSMGNRALVVQRRKAGFGEAARFLGDPATAEYFRRILPRLAGPVSDDAADAAVLAAEAVFDTFLTAVHAWNEKAAA